MTGRHWSLLMLLDNYEVDIEHSSHVKPGYLEWSDCLQMNKRCEKTTTTNEAEFKQKNLTLNEKERGMFQYLQRKRYPHMKHFFPLPIEKHLILGTPR
ncbi:hypothetical protein HI914_06384 [Erysiphe necator]|nr:hypothetical protein HI914_06384 [Erysiphe necator]